WKTLNLQGAIFSVFAVVTFLTLYGSYFAFKPVRLGELAGLPILINGQPLKLPVEPVLRLIALALSLVIAAITGAGLIAEWTTFASASGGCAGCSTIQRFSPASRTRVRTSH